MDIGQTFYRNKVRFRDDSKNKRFFEKKSLERTTPLMDYGNMQQGLNPYLTDQLFEKRAF